MWRAVVDTSRAVTRLVRRHRRAIVVGGLVGATVCLYYRTKRALREAAEAHEEIVRRAGLEARWRACLGRTRTECGEAIVNFLPTLRKRLLLVVDVTGPVRELKSLRGMRGGTGSGGSRASADGSAVASSADMERREVELWEEVKVTALTRLVVGLYAFNMLSLMLRMQLHILGRIASEEAEELLSRASRGRETSRSSPPATPGAPANLEGSGDETTMSKALGTAPESTLDFAPESSSGKPFSGTVSSGTAKAAETAGVAGGAGQEGCEQGVQVGGSALSMAARRELLTATYEYMLGDGLRELAADVERAVARYTSSWQAHTRQGVTFKDLVGVIRAVRMEVEASGTIPGVAPGLGGGHAGGDLDRGFRGAIGREPASSRALNVFALVRYIINTAYDGEADAGAGGVADADDGVEASRESQGGDVIFGTEGSALADGRAADDVVTMAAAKAKANTKKPCEDGVQGVLDETWDAAESPNFALALQSSLDATFGMVYEQLRQKAFCRAGVRPREATPGDPARAGGRISVGEGGEGPGGGRAASSPDEHASPGVGRRSRGSTAQDAASSASSAPGIGEGEGATQVLATVISQAKLVVSEVLESSTTNRYSQTLASLPTVEDLCFSVFFLNEQLPESSEPIPSFEPKQLNDFSMGNVAGTLASPMFEPRGTYSATGLEGSLGAR